MGEIFCSDELRCRNQKRLSLKRYEVERLPFKSERMNLEIRERIKLCFAVSFRLNLKDGIGAIQERNVTTADIENYCRECKRYICLLSVSPG